MRQWEGNRYRQDIAAIHFQSRDMLLQSSSYLRIVKLHNLSSLAVHAALDEIRTRFFKTNFHATVSTYGEDMSLLARIHLKATPYLDLMSNFHIVV